MRRNEKVIKEISVGNENIPISAKYIGDYEIDDIKDDIKDMIDQEVISGVSDFSFYDETNATTVNFAIKSGQEGRGGIYFDTVNLATGVTGETYSACGDITITAATTEKAGVMSAADKTKLNGIAAGANKYTLPTASSSILGGVKIGSNISVSSGTISLTKANVTSALGYTPPTTNTTYGLANLESNGLMSATTFTAMAENTAISSLGDISFETVSDEDGVSVFATQGYTRINYTNYEGDYIEQAVVGTIDIPAATTENAGVMTANDKSKLDGIATGANKYTLPNATSSTLGGVKVGSNITVSNGTISLTKANVTNALGYTPPTTNSTYANYSFGNGYATCATASSTTAKTATYANYSLVTGGVVAVKFTNAVLANSTLNINSMGAKSIYYKGAAIKSNVISANSVALFVYDGTNYVLLSIDKMPTATTSTEGLMSASDKVKLNNLKNNYETITFKDPDYCNNLGIIGDKIPLDDIFQMLADYCYSYSTDTYGNGENSFKLIIRPKTSAGAEVGPYYAIFDVFNIYESSPCYPDDTNLQVIRFSGFVNTAAVNSLNLTGGYCGILKYDGSEFVERHIYNLGGYEIDTSKTLINFTVNGIKFTALSGYNFAQLVADPTMKPLGWYIYDGKVYTGRYGTGGYYITVTSGATLAVSPHDAIQANKAYGSKLTTT